MEYEWNIEQCEHDPETGVILVAHWSCSARSEEVSDRVYGSVGFEADPTSPDFIPYADLTEANVLSWVWNSGVDKDETEALLAARIEKKKSPAVVSGLPWFARAEEPQAVSQPATSWFRSRT